MRIKANKRPLVVFGATGRLASQLILLACAEDWPTELTLHGSDARRLEGLAEELLDAGFDLPMRTTTDAQEALSEGGYVFYAGSVPSRKQTREAMLLDNAPLAVKVGRCLRECGKDVPRVVCVSNPSDLIGLTLLVHSRLDPSRVLSLSALDTTRYRKELVRQLHLDESMLKGAWTLGSHDESMAVMKDTVRIGQESLSDFLRRDDSLPSFDDIRRCVKKGGAHIIQLRGHTAYQGPAWLCYRMLRATDEQAFTLPTARYLHTPHFPHTFLSLPCIIDTHGCTHRSVCLSEEDYEAFARSYASVSHQVEVLLQHSLLPPREEWPAQLQTLQDELVNRCRTYDKDI